MADTIAALSTGGGLSAIGILRLSGDAAITVADSVFKPQGIESMEKAENRKLCYGELLDQNGETIDFCLCTVSRAPSSYTGENTAEFQCHGSPIILSAALEAVFSKGARQANPGEFTKRAFLNGRLDLTQAEAVIDLIDSETAEAAKNAAGQLGRSIGRKTDAVYDKLVDIMSHFHAVIDYPDEDIEDFQLEEYDAVFYDAENTLQKLADTFTRGKILKEGIKSAIIGRPNTGKSSMLNALLGYERAIVTDIAGTTRDTIEEKVKIGGVLLRLSDTAGMRETDDTVEKIGVERALAAAEESQLVLAVFDGSDELTEEDREVLKAVSKAPRSVAVINKSDLGQTLLPEDIKEYVNEVCVVSAKTGEGISALGDTIKGMFSGGEEVPCGEIITNARQAEAVTRALMSVKAAREALGCGVTPDAVLTEIEAALFSLGELTGKTVRDDVTDRIFSRFCVGK